MFKYLLALLIGMASLSQAQEIESMEDLNDQNSVDEIVSNGERVLFGDISKSTVAIQAYGKVMCSGTIIGKDLVLTASHCLDGISHPSYVRVVSQGMFFSHEVMAFRKHPDYTHKRIALGLGGKRGVSDVAVIRVTTPFSPSMRAALMPTRILSLNDQSAIVAGFGRTSKYANDQGQLRAADVRVSDSRYENQMVQSGRSLACPGDSGGPIYLRSQAGLMVVGIHAWGNCSMGMAYSESVSRHLPWLVETIRELRSLRDL